jgi:hypothetical protein
MLKFVTILIATTTFDGQDTAITFAPYVGPHECGLAIPAVSAAFNAFPDLVVRCVPTPIISQSPFPKRRPEHLK